jgi:SAM-dependent methyltransferase
VRAAPSPLVWAEAAHRTPWIAEEIHARFGPSRARVLDVGHGAGFLAGALAARGADVTVRWHLGDPYRMPYRDGAFDVVCAMDLFEHAVSPARVVVEASRVLAPRGLFFFHAYARTIFAWRARAWVLFRTPEEVRDMCTAAGLALHELRGQRPSLGWPLIRMLATGVAPNDLAFRFTPSLAAGFVGLAEKG